MASSSAKAALFDALASVGSAVGNGRRAEIVDVLAQGERSVEEIAGEISQSVARPGRARPHEARGNAGLLPARE
jgi:DNA-binding transcriptional ArsR family regulator